MIAIDTDDDLREQAAGNGDVPDEGFPPPGFRGGLVPAGHGGPGPAAGGVGHKGYVRLPLVPARSDR